MVTDELIVERAGVQSLVVAAPRLGHRHEAIAWCGAFDGRAYDDANALLGNDPAAAAIEIAYGNFAARFTSARTFALAGADADARLDGVPVPPYRSIAAARGSTLRLGSPRAGARTILAIAGGIAVPAILGSRSTDLRSRFGGFHGRALRDGDRLALDAAVPLQPRARERIESDARPRVVRERIHLPDGVAFSQLCSRRWKASPQSDRMGIRCEGEPLLGERPTVATLAVFPGAIQLPPSGLPIVLGVDAQTTGGYPVLASVIAEDLWKLGQVRLGEEITFVPVRTIDLNADLGEGCADDAALLEIVTSANIACGGHAGDERSMRETIRAARRNGVAIGAHPSYPDREGFGRRAMDLVGEDLVALVIDQVSALARIAREEGARLTHVKPHGALYNRSAVDESTADAIARAVAELDRNLALVGLAGSFSTAMARRYGLRSVEELFADRRYGEDGFLIPRGEPGASIESVEEAADQALALARSGRGESICLHGDGAHALSFARAVRARLLEAGFILRSAATLDP